MNNDQENPLKTSISKFITEHRLILPGQTLVLGLSGGPDSIFLLNFLAPTHQAGIITLIAAHLDHGWRHNSSEDARFCHAAADAYNITYVSAKLSDLDLKIKRNGSCEEVGRRARRIFLENIKNQYHADAIVLAHHFDDQQETFFIRMLRGASLTGLSAMHPRHGFYIRPLLQTKKSDILAYLHERAIAYVLDPTNDALTYLRNRIRHHVIPALRATDDRFDTTFGHTLSNLQNTERYLYHHTSTIFQTVVSINPTAIDVKKLLALDPFMQNRLIIHWLCANKVPFTPSTALVDEIMRFLKQPAGGSHTIHSHWSLVKKQSIISIHHIK